MPTLIEMRLKATWTVSPDTRQLHGLACALFEAGDTEHARQDKQFAAGPPLSAVTAGFASPTYFSQNGLDCVVPDPRLIAGSWRRRWNASLPDGDSLTVGDDAWRATIPVLGLAAFDLKTQTRDSGHGRDRAGFTGSATLRLAKGVPAAARQVLGTLARFAEYCGTGAQTTHGFGATFLLPGIPDG
jgi:CRISPR/Cas system endoribonuclease Cas6 (RAMP superfamily)